MWATALSYITAGFSIIPIRPFKKPAIAQWKPYQTRRATNQEIYQWFGNDNSKEYGIAVITGAISGNAETLDFDEPSLFPLWCERVDDHRPGLIEHLTVIKTPSGGRQVPYRCETIGRNQKLARRLIEVSEATDGSRLLEGKWVKIVDLIETRGEGGYVVAPGTPPHCHPDNRPYKVLAGEFPQIPVISPKDREILLIAARLLNEYVPPDRRPVERKLKTHMYTGRRPDNGFKGCSDWNLLLMKHGWQQLDQKGEVTYWKRPSKREPEASATTNYKGSGLLYVFSTNAAPFKPNKAYSFFGAYALLEHNGNFKAAAKAITELKKTKKRVEVIEPLRIEQLYKPTSTLKLAPLIRPTNTQKLSMPARPALTFKIHAKATK